jgi:hypothetical protein
MAPWPTPASAWRAAMWRDRCKASPPKTWVPGGRLSGAGGVLAWSASLFRSDSDNDIMALASAIQGRGYFTNVAAT